MLKHIFLTVFLLFSSFGFSQVGINTAYPKGIFHVDGNADNPKNSTNTPNATQQANDFIILSDGKVGIGTIAPTNKVEINNGSASNTGLKLTTGASAGKVLVSDANGNAIWGSTNNVFTTIVALQSGNQDLPVSSATIYQKISQMNDVRQDDAAVTYSGYGWQSNSQYNVPRTGRYRISLSVYYRGASSVNIGQNWRVAVSKTSSYSQSSIVTLPFSSIVTTTSDQTTYFSGIANLVKDDQITVVYTNQTGTNSVLLSGGDSQTILTIEAL